MFWLRIAMRHEQAAIEGEGLLAKSPNSPASPLYAHASTITRRNVGVTPRFPFASDPSVKGAAPHQNQGPRATSGRRPRPGSLGDAATVPVAAEQRECPNRNDGLMEEVNDQATSAALNEKGGAVQSGRRPGFARRHLGAGTAYWMSLCRFREVLIHHGFSGRFSWAILTEADNGRITLD